VALSASECLPHQVHEAEQRAAVRYHAFSESDEEGADKLVDTLVPLRRLRPLPPPTPASFLLTLAAGVPLEFAFEDGWWQGTLVYVAEAGVYPPVLLLCGYRLEFYCSSLLRITFPLSRPSL
jgi:hypothetical protein